MHLNQLQIYKIWLRSLAYISLYFIFNLVIDNKARVSYTNVCNPMWDIFILPRQRFSVDITLEDKYNMIWRMKSISYLWRLTCAYWLPHLITYGSGIGWVQGFEPGLQAVLVLVEPVGYSLGYSIGMLLDLSLRNYFGPLERYLVGVSLGPLPGLMIVNREGSLVGLILRLPLGSPHESLNPGAELSGTLLYSPLGLWFGSCAVWG